MEEKKKLNNTYEAPSARVIEIGFTGLLCSSVPGPGEGEDPTQGPTYD